MRGIVVDWEEVEDREATEADVRLVTELLVDFDGQERFEVDCLAEDAGTCRIARNRQELEAAGPKGVRAIIGYLNGWQDRAGHLRLRWSIGQELRDWLEARPQWAEEVKACGSWMCMGEARHV